MKNLYLSLTLAALAITGATAQPIQQKSANCLSQGTRISNYQPFAKWKTTADSKIKAQRPSLNRFTTFADEAATNDIITATPEGTLYKGYYRTGASFIDLMGSIVNQAIDGLYGQYVIAPDNKTVYIYNPLNAYWSNTWIKGEITKGDTIEVKLPQHMVHEVYVDGTQDGYLYKLKVGKVDLDGDGQLDTTFLPDDDQTAKFVWRNDTIYFVNTMADSKVLGMCNAKGDWYGYGDYVHQAVKLNETPITPADASKATTYAMAYTQSGQNYGIITKMLTEGNDVFVQGLCSNLPKAWVKGTRKGSQVQFNSRQFLGLDSITQSYLYFSASGKKPTKYNYDGEEYYFDEPCLRDSIVFTYDGEAHTLQSDSAFVINQGYHVINQLDTYETPTFAPWTEKALTPPVAANIAYSPYDEQLGYGILNFEVPFFTENGELLDMSQLYYSIYLDNNVFTFSPDEYTGFSTDVTEVPSLYSDKQKLYYYAGVNSVYFTVTGFDKIGVQMIYKAGGEEHKSAIKYVSATSDDTDGITTATTAGVPVLSTTYTDLSGRRTVKPAQGAYIQTMRLANGTVKTVKRIMK